MLEIDETLFEQAHTIGEEEESCVKVSLASLRIKRVNGRIFHSVISLRGVLAEWLDGRVCTVQITGDKQQWLRILPCNDGMVKPYKMRTTTIMNLQIIDYWPSRVLYAAFEYKLKDNILYLKPDDDWQTSAVEVSSNDVLKRAYKTRLFTHKPAHREAQNDREREKRRLKAESKPTLAELEQAASEQTITEGSKEFTEVAIDYSTFTEAVPKTALPYACVTTSSEVEPVSAPISEQPTELPDDGKSLPSKELVAMFQPNVKTVDSEVANCLAVEQPIPFHVINDIQINAVITRDSASFAELIDEGKQKVRNEFRPADDEQPPTPKAWDAPADPLPVDVKRTQPANLQVAHALMTPAALIKKRAQSAKKNTPAVALAKPVIALTPAPPIPEGAPHGSFWFKGKLISPPSAEQVAERKQRPPGRPTMQTPFQQVQEKEKEKEALGPKGNAQRFGNFKRS